MLVILHIFILLHNRTMFILHVRVDLQLALHLYTSYDKMFVIKIICTCSADNKITRHTQMAAKFVLSNFTNYLIKLYNFSLYTYTNCTSIYLIKFSCEIILFAYVKLVCCVNRCHLRLFLADRRPSVSAEAPCEEPLPPTRAWASASHTGVGLYLPHERGTLASPTSVDLCLPHERGPLPSLRAWTSAFPTSVDLCLPHERGPLPSPRAWTSAFPTSVDLCLPHERGPLPPPRRGPLPPSQAWVADR